MKRIIWHMVVLTGIASLCIGFTTPIYAEIQRTELRVDGLSCPFCSLGLEKKLKGVEGVTAVEIHMKKGLADIRTNPDKPPRFSDMRIAVKEAGFTLRDIHLTVTGEVNKEDKFWVLKSSGDGMRFLLFGVKPTDEGHGQSEMPVVLGDVHVQKLEEAAKIGAPILVEGRVHEHTDTPPGLLVERLKLQR